MELFFATSSNHKLQEAQRILHPWPVSSLDDYVAPAEDGATLAANATIKLTEALQQYPNCIPIFAEDTGLFVDALNQAPGVHTARYAGSDATDTDNVNCLLHALKGVGLRTACFRTVIACASNQKDATETIHIVEGCCYGTIAEESNLLKLGNGLGNGFGYDPVFIPQGATKSFSALPAAVKDACSHRMKALNELKAYLMS